MKAIPNDVKQDLAQTEATDATKLAIHGARVLSLQEIKAVAGGPEGTVGTGMSPP
jgi:hypothetical protein